MPPHVVGPARAGLYLHVGRIPQDLGATVHCLQRALWQEGREGTARAEPRQVRVT